MSARVVQLADSGLTPALRAAEDSMRKSIWQAIDLATEAGVPAGMIVGSMKFIEAAIIYSHFRSAEQESTDG